MDSVERPWFVTASWVLTYAELHWVVVGPTPSIMHVNAFVEIWQDVSTVWIGGVFHHSFYAAWRPSSFDLYCKWESWGCTVYRRLSLFKSRVLWTLFFPNGVVHGFSTPHFTVHTAHSESKIPFNQRPLSSVLTLTLLFLSISIWTPLFLSLSRPRDGRRKGFHFSPSTGGGSQPRRLRLCRRSWAPQKRRKPFFVFLLWSKLGFCYSHCPLAFCTSMRTVFSVWFLDFVTLSCYHSLILSVH